MSYTISERSLLVPAPAAPKYPMAVFDSVTGKVVVVYTDANDSYNVYVVVGSIVSGVVIFGTPVSLGETLYSTAPSDSTSIIKDAISGKIVVAVKTGYVYIGSISGNSISFGSAVQFATSCNYIKLGQTSSGVVICYLKTTETYKPYAIAGVISGNSISLGSPVLLENVAAVQSHTFSIAYSIANSRTLITWLKSSPRYSMAVALSVYGTTISIGTPVAICSTATTYSNSACYDSTTGYFL